METIKEIRNRMESVADTRKITNAMYLIASAKLRRAKADLDKTRPYFNALKTEIKRVFRVDSTIDSPYFYPLNEEHDLPGDYGYLVITADKGLAGAYNQNVIKRAAELMREHDGAKLFVVGEYGRQYFTARKIPIEQSFLYTAQNPTIHRARKIASILLERYLRGDLRKIFIIYTDLAKGATETVSATRLLPFHRADFSEDAENAGQEFEFSPSLGAVLDGIAPNYVTGFIYSALVDSFCSEQNARMAAMDAANRNAEELLAELKLQYNHVRQSAVTQEIAEISAGVRHRNGKEERTV